MPAEICQDSTKVVGWRRLAYLLQGGGEATRSRIHTEEVKRGFRRAQFSSFLSASSVLLMIRDDLLVFGMIVIVVILSFVLLPSRNPASDDSSVDRAMAAMVGGTGGGLVGAVLALLMNAMWEHTAPIQSMEIMTASMAGMIGGAIGGGWQLFINNQSLEADGHTFKRPQVHESGKPGEKSSHKSPFSRAN